MKQKTWMTVAALLTLFGAVLFYDAVMVFLFNQLADANHHIGFDAKELAIALGAIVAGIAVLGRLLGGHRDQWKIPGAVLSLGLIVPAVFGFEIRSPLWFTERDEVTSLSGRYEGEERLVRTRYIRYLDDADAADLATTLEPAPSPMEVTPPPVSEVVLPAEESRATEPPNPEPMRPEELAESSDDYVVDEACGNANDVAPESMTLVEQATGSVNAMSRYYSEDAESLLQRAIDIDPENVLAYNRLGLLYLKEREQPAVAIDLLTRAVTALPDCSSLYFDLGNAYSATKDYARAQVELTKAVRLMQSPPASYYYNLANAYLNAGDSRDSIDYYLQALKANPSHSGARINLTWAYLNERLDQELLELHQGDADALRRIGVTLNRQKDHQAAIQFFNRSLAVEEDVETYVHLGIAFGTMGRMQEARSAPEKALKIDPNHEMALTVRRLATSPQD